MHTEQEKFSCISILLGRLSQLLVCNTISIIMLSSSHQSSFCQSLTHRLLRDCWSLVSSFFLLLSNFFLEQLLLLFLFFPLLLFSGLSSGLLLPAFCCQLSLKQLSGLEESPRSSSSLFLAIDSTVSLASMNDSRSVLLSMSSTRVFILLITLFMTAFQSSSCCWSSLSSWLSSLRFKDFSPLSCCQQTSSFQTSSSFLSSFQSELLLLSCHCRRSTSLSKRSLHRHLIAAFIAQPHIFY